MSNGGGSPQPQQQASTLEILIQVGKWIYENSSSIGEAISVLLKGVTNIKHWTNDTDHEVEVWKLDGGPSRRDHYRIAPHQTLNADMWIPWADNPAHYREKHATIQVGGQPLAYIWQSGPAIRFNIKDEFVPGGQVVPGESRAGGNRSMVIASDPEGRIGFALGGYPPPQ